jgi:hypothetical protein
MVLTTRQSNDLLAKHGCFVRECCDRCSQVLGPVRFTVRGEPGAWCSRLCRDGVDQRPIRKGGRPKKYKTDVERCRAERQQSTARKRVSRMALCHAKPPCSLAETRDLQARF